MKPTVLRWLPLLALTFSLLCGLSLPAAAADKKAVKAAAKPAAAAPSEKATPTIPADHEAATRLQVLLDRANFGPGKIDGRFGGFSEKALGLYREAHGLVIEQRLHHQITGEVMKFMSIADHTGIVETELFADTYRSFGIVTVRYPVLEVHATVEPYENGRGFSLHVHRVTKPRKIVKHCQHCLIAVVDFRNRFNSSALMRIWQQARDEAKAS